MVGPFKTAPGGLTHLLVAVDKFTKWIKVKPIKKIDGSSTIKFLNEIIVRYGVPHNIITDNGRNFAKASGWTWRQWHILSPTGKWRRQMV
jgi:hypothetical protein